MKATITIFLLVLLASVQTPLGQLFKLPFLMEHFYKHQNQGGVSLLDFLKSHYASTHHDADLPEDNQLPFKSIIDYSIGFAIVPSVIRTNLIPLQARAVTSGLIRAYALQQHLASIFHPPRLAISISNS